MFALKLSLALSIFGAIVGVRYERYEEHHHEPIYVHEPIREHFENEHHEEIQRAQIIPHGDAYLKQATTQFMRMVDRETNIVDIFKKYVINVKVKEGDQGEMYLEDLEGRPVKGEGDSKVIISAPSSSETSSSLGRQTIITRPSIIYAANAGCIKRNVTIRILPDLPPHIFFYPKCVVVERCAGCCTGDGLLVCTASQTHKRDIQIRKYDLVNLDDRGQGMYIGFGQVFVDEDDECKCECKTKPWHCTRKQVYDASSCSCTCTDKAAHEKCNKQKDQTLSWHYHDCSCSCRYQRCDSEDFYFDYKSCACEVLPD